ncbi:MAG: hypothetical protein V4684_11125 [Pseudomonadota bacterium]
MSTQPDLADTKSGNFNDKEPPPTGKPVSNRPEAEGSSHQDPVSPVGHAWPEGRRGTHSGVNEAQESQGAGVPGEPPDRAGMPPKR